MSAVQSSLHTLDLYQAAFSVSASQHLKANIHSTVFSQAWQFLNPIYQKSQTLNTNGANEMHSFSS
jgi:hypothetical protein